MNKFGKPTAWPEWGSAGERAEPSTGKKQSGFVQGTGPEGESPYYQHLNWWFNTVSQWVQYLAEGKDHTHVLGSQSQVTSGAASVYFDTTVPDFKDSAGNPVTFQNDESILIVGLDALTTTLNFQQRLYIEGAPGFVLNPGGQEVHFAGAKSIIRNLEFTNTVAGSIRVISTATDIRMDVTVNNLENTPIYNEAVRNVIVANGIEIFNFRKAGTIIWSLAKEIIPPYRHHCNGLSLNSVYYQDLIHEPTVAEPWGIGDRYGITGTTLYLPDLRGRIPRFWSENDTTTDLNQGARSDSKSTGTGGVMGNFVGTKQGDAFQGHYHTIQGNIHTSNRISSNGGSTADHYNTQSLGGGYGPQIYHAATVITGTDGPPKTASESRPKNTYFLCYMHA